MKNVVGLNDYENNLSREPIAVVAMSCRLPGANSPQEFWRIILDGKSPIREVPDSWLNHKIYFDPQPGKIGKTYSKLGSIFDTKNIENEIKNYKFHKKFRNQDPLLKLAYIIADEVIREVVIPSDKTDFGIYIGGLRASDFCHDYMFSTAAEVTFKTLYELPEFAQLSLQVQHEIVAQCVYESRLNYRNDNYWTCKSPEFRLGDFVANLRDVYGWTGAAYSLDAACASSLVAIDCAITDILTGKIQGALVGGISAMTILTPILFAKNFAATATLSRPFDANADGMVGSMGIVFAFLKSLSAAEKDGDSILGLIRGVGFSSDGRGKSLWAPRPEGELAAMKRAYQKSGITPQQLCYLEAHATSTNVGDSVELKTIESLLNCTQKELQNDCLLSLDSTDNSYNNSASANNLSDNSTSAEFLYENVSADSKDNRINVTNNRDKMKLAIGSVKANFGHTFEAAGLVGLMKVVQICKNKIIPPQINISQLHPDIRERELSFFIPQEIVRLKNLNDPKSNANVDANAGELFFGVNSFGVGGLNAHLIFEEYKKNKSAAENQNRLSNQKKSTPKKSTSIAVIGIGCVYPRAFSIDEFQTVLKEKIDPKQPLSSFELKRRYFSDQKIGGGKNDSEICGGFIENYLYDWEFHKIPPLQIQRCDPLQTFAMGAVDEAMKSAISGRELSNAERSKTFVVAGSVQLSNFFYEYQLGMRAQEVGQIVQKSAKVILSKFDNSAKQLNRNLDSPNLDIFANSDSDLISDKISRDFIKKIIRENSCVSDVTGSFSSSSIASRITKLYDLHGGAFTIDGGAVSSLIAIDYSLQKLRCGDGLIGICIGAYRWTNSDAFEFYRSRYGEKFFPLAEGAGAVVLKSIEQVDQSKEKPLGLIREVIRVTRCRIDKSVWDSLDLSIDELQFISVSIASSEPSVQLNLLEAFFRNEKRIRPIPVMTCRDQFGNFCSGAGMAEIIKSFLILRERTIYSQFDWQDKIDESGLFFVTKNPIELKLNERSFAVLFDLDENGDGYAAILLPFIVAQNKDDVESETLKVRPIERQNLQYLQKLLEMENLEDKEFPKRVYVYRQVGVSYDAGFGLGVADAMRIERLIQTYDDVKFQDEFFGEMKFNEMLSRGRELLGESGIDELRGIADGSGVSFEKLFLYNIRFYSGLTGIHFLLRDSGMFKHVVIFENSLCEIFGDLFDINLLECEPSDNEPYLRASVTGCIGAVAACRAGISVTIIPRLKNIISKNQFATDSSLLHFVNIASFLGDFNNNSNDTNELSDVLIVDSFKGNFKLPTVEISEYNLISTKNLIQKFSSTQRYFCTIMLSDNKIEIL
jgi:3-oxoacyl-(acyl-carrier-protein) synthase